MFATITCRCYTKWVMKTTLSANVQLIFLQQQHQSHEAGNVDHVALAVTSLKLCIRGYCPAQDARAHQLLRPLPLPKVLSTFADIIC